MISRIDRYVFREWAKVFALTLLAVKGLLVLDDVQSNLPDLLDFGAGTEEIIRYYALTLPTYLPHVIPLSVLVSLLFALGQLHRYHEITAMRCAGLGLFRITRSLWAAGAFLALLLFYLNADWIPNAVESSRTLRDNLRYEREIDLAATEDVGIIHNLTFYNHADGRLWFVNRFSERTYRAYGVTISEIRDSGAREVRRIVANEGYFDDIAGIWVLLRGRETLFSEETGDAVRSIAFEEKVLPDFTEDPELMKFLEKRPRDLSFFELQRIITTLSPEEDARVADYARQYYEILFNPFGVLIIVALAIPFAVSGVRTNPMVGVTKSLGLFVVYYLAVNTTRFLGTDYLSPMHSALLPNLIMLAVAGYFFWRATRPT
ncbi:MAG: LptF/LptG family permease [Opitutales bacterium]|nr:LptF/LptG family permease [Opitutales bacterium]